MTEDKYLEPEVLPKPGKKHGSAVKDSRKPGNPRTPDPVTGAVYQPSRKGGCLPGQEVIVVGDHPLSVVEWTMFQEFYKTSSTSEAMQQVFEITGEVVPMSTLRSWRRMEWWKELHERFVKDGQDRFIMQLAEASEKIAKGLLDVATGIDKDDRTAMARVQAARVFSEMGKDPVTNRRSDVMIQDNRQVNVVNITPDRMRGLTPEQLIDYVRTKRLPEVP